MEMYAASDVSKEDAIKIAEQVSLVPVTDADKAEAVLALDWSVYDAKTDKEEGTYEDKTITKAAREDINIHQQGESFPVKGKGLTARVTDVKVMDDISLLDARYVDEDFRNELDGNGKLLPATIQYIKDGNKDTVSQEISSRQVPQKLVYITTEYTNTGDKEMKDVLFFGQLIRIREEGGQMQIAEDETPGENDNWDRAVNHGLSAFWEMPYYDVRGGDGDCAYGLGSHRGRAGQNVYQPGAFWRHTIQRRVREDRLCGYPAVTVGNKDPVDGWLYTGKTKSICTYGADTFLLYRKTAL